MQDPPRVHGLLNLRRPEASGEFMQSLQTVNWMRCGLRTGPRWRSRSGRCCKIDFVERSA